MDRPLVDHLLRNPQCNTMTRQPVCDCLDGVRIEPAAVDGRGVQHHCHRIPHLRHLRIIASTEHPVPRAGLGVGASPSRRRSVDQSPGWFVGGQIRQFGTAGGSLPLEEGGRSGGHSRAAILCVSATCAAGLVTSESRHFSQATPEAHRPKVLPVVCRDQRSVVVGVRAGQRRNPFATTRPSRGARPAVGTHRR